LPFGLIASSINSAILIIYMAYHRPSQELIIWAGIMLVMSVLGMFTALRAGRRGLLPRPRPVEALFRPIAESALLGLAWAMCPILLLPTAEGFDVAIILCVCAGMMTGAAFVLSTLLGAAIPFVASLSFGLGVGLLRMGNGSEQITVLALLASFTIVMIRTTSWNFSNYVRSWSQQVKLEDQTQLLKKKASVISLLLNEFEQAASDTLWETDAEQRIVRPSATLCERSRMAVSDLEHKHLVSFFDAANVEACPEMKRLRDALASNGEINNLCLPALTGNRTRWWRISAKPILSDAGVFEGYRGVASDVTEKRLAEKQIYNLANFDSLTGVPKREMLIETIDAAVSRTDYGASGFALLALDVDRFKTINDVYGHAAGDAYLKATAQRLKELLGPNDMVARFGGDEFVILQMDLSSQDEAMAMAARIQQTLSEPVMIDGISAQSSVSVGISVYPEHSQQTGCLLKFADLALLASKAAGRNTVSFFDAELNDEISERIAMEDDLRDALQRNEFSLNFQPIIHTKSGRFGAFESLIRWNHPERGSVGADDFVPILEQAGMITRVGDWIIREALREASTWDETVRISINLSPLQVRNRSLITTVTHALAQTGVDPRRVDFEITETALFDDTEESLGALHALRKLGVTISLDDFGTGYSSLSLLRIFPFDKIKIDKSFVQQIESSEECIAIVRSIVGLAHSLGMRTTAEGVETQSIADKLTAEGCLELQGYLYGHPMLSDGLVEAGFLKRSEPVAIPAEGVEIVKSWPGRRIA
jgi:diguanylate cyclase (GGDEF)-like protein